MSFFSLDEFAENMRGTAENLRSGLRCIVCFSRTEEGQVQIVNAETELDLDWDVGSNSLFCVLDQRQNNVRVHQARKRVGNDDEERQAGLPVGRETPRETRITGIPATNSFKNRSFKFKVYDHEPGWNARGEINISVSADQEYPEIIKTICDFTKRKEPVPLIISTQYNHRGVIDRYNFRFERISDTDNRPEENHED